MNISSKGHPAGTRIFFVLAILVVAWLMPSTRETFWEPIGRDLMIMVHAILRLIP